MAWVNDPLILASASVVRARLLAAAGVEFRIEPAGIDEASVKRVYRVDRRTSVDCALALAEAKAQSVSRWYRSALIIGADQILVCGGEWFDKPADIEEAASHLRRLRGRSHALVTAAICQRFNTLPTSSIGNR